MDFINGVIRVLYLKNEGVYFPIGCLLSNGFNEGVTMLDTTVRTNKDGWKSSVPTTQNYSIDFDGLEMLDYIQGDKITYHDLKRLKRKRILVEWKIDDGNENYSFGKGYITSLSDSASIDEFISFNGNIEGSGAPENVFDFAYFGYKDRVELDGGSLSSEKCTQLLIEKWLNN